MTSVFQAQEIIKAHTAALATETGSLAQAHGRVLREPVVSPDDMPSFDRSAMDGYAIRADDPADEFNLVAEIRAGQSIDRQLQAGQAIRILTGARLPGLGLKVIMQEHVEMRDGQVRLLKRTAVSNVRLRGEDARAGEILLKPGATVDATAIALLASMGRTSLLVSRQPRIFHLTTGDEIVAPEKTPAPGQIRNSNAFLISALCREYGAGMVTHSHAADDLPALLQLVLEAKAESYDLVLISGGSGQGSYDFSGEVFRQLGATIHFREVDVRPGKPLIFGTAASGGATQVIFGLPGNALSHFVCFHLFVRLTLARLLAQTGPTLVSGFLAKEMSGTFNARETWWPGQVSVETGRLKYDALPWKSSGDITRLPMGNALMKVPASTSCLEAGISVELLLTRGLAG